MTVRLKKRTARSHEDLHIPAAEREYIIWTSYENDGQGVKEPSVICTFPWASSRVPRERKRRPYPAGERRKAPATSTPHLFIPSGLFIALGLSGPCLRTEAQ